MRTYHVNEVFYSLQGEGVRAGTANVFVRLSGCNLTCSRDGEAGFDCDTEFASGRPMSASDVLEAALEVAGECRCVIFTGGEPALQLDAELLDAFATWHKAVETNGTRELPQGRLDWVCVSPKSAEHTIRVLEADEVKYVRHAGQPIPRPVCKARHKLLSPAFETFSEDGGPQLPSSRALAWCVQLVKEHPDWRLSVQQHKAWVVR